MRARNTCRNFDQTRQSSRQRGCDPRTRLFDDFQCQPDDLAAARQTWQLSRDTSGSRALIGRCEVHPWSAGGVFGKTRPSNAGGDLRIPDIVSQYSMYLQFFLPDGELALVQDKLSVMAGAHAGAAAQQQ
eukprot:Tamp_26885.p3 GENE.Tamp_26885~~Tamp_26885.p3  ORF type:complete len:130 (-),score=18.13 Tamp_26885:63-452(-)